MRLMAASTTRFTVRARTSDGPEIHTLDDWERYASTKGKWADGYSAKELARLWLAGDGATYVEEALAGVMPGLSVQEAIAEARTIFDGYPGGVRNHDVLALGAWEGGQAVVGVEGKVNESLDAKLSAKYGAAAKRKRNNLNSNLDLRVDDLLAALIGKRYGDDPALAGLRYQVLSALAGTVAEAAETTTAAAVVIHLLDTRQAKPKKFRETRAAVADFAHAAGLPTQDVIGPVALKAPIMDAPSGLPVYLTVIETAPAADAARRPSS